MTTGATADLPHHAIPLSWPRCAVLLAVCTLTHPSVRSVARAAGLSPSVTYHHLRILRHQGFVEWGQDFSGRTLGGTLRPTHALHAPTP